MHDGMPYNPIQGQGQGHGLLKFLDLGGVPAVSLFTAKFFQF